MTPVYPVIVQILFSFGEPKGLRNLGPKNLWPVAPQGVSTNAIRVELMNSTESEQI